MMRAVAVAAILALTAAEARADLVLTGMPEVAWMDGFILERMSSEKFNGMTDRDGNPIPIRRVYDEGEVEYNARRLTCHITLATRLPGMATIQERGLRFYFDGNLVTDKATSIRFPCR